MTVASRETAVLCLCCSRGILEAGVPETRGLQVLAAGDKGIHCSAKAIEDHLWRPIDRPGPGKPGARPTGRWLSPRRPPPLPGGRVFAQASTFPAREALTCPDLACPRAYQRVHAVETQRLRSCAAELPQF